MAQFRVSRRTLLRGMGVSLALPWLDAMGPLRAWADEHGGQTQPAPNRLAFFYVPNGVNMADWTPKTEGPDFELPHTLQPLADVKDELLVLSGLTADGARPHGDGPGDHARALASFLTGSHPVKTDGTDIRNGISVDQVAASRIGHLTRLGSLEIGGEAGQMAGNCDSGYSCVYSSTMSWRSATQPLPKVVNPKLVFERLFGNGSAEEQKARDARRKSVLDFVLADANDLQRGLGTTDRRKLDEYFSAVREIEQRIARAGSNPVQPPTGFAVPDQPPAEFDATLRLLCDLLVLAFQTDTTRICTFVMANEGSNRSYPSVGVPEGHHDLSHHQNNAEKKTKLRNINTFHITQFAYLLKKLKSIPEGEGTLLDHCLIAYGSANSDGDRHNHDDLPVLLAGRGGGTVKSGRHLRFPKETPIANLWLSCLERVDVSIPFLGDSTGLLTSLNG